MEREFISVGMKVIPHSKSVCGYGDLNSSINWQHATRINQPYLFVSSIYPAYIVLDFIKDSNSGDYFLPEDFEPYIEENQEINNESRNIKMKKSDLNSSMLFKMRDGDLCALLDDNEGNKVFCNKEDIEQGYSSYHVSINDYDEELSSEGDDYDIVAIKQLDSCVRVVCDVLEENEPEEWDWVEEVKKVEDVENDKSDNEKNVVNNITINITVDANDDPANFLKQLNDALRKNGFH